MAIANFQRTVYHSGGNLATGRVQYITRTGPYQSQAEARVLHQGFEADSEQVREDLVYWRARNLPAWAHDDPVTFFSAAEKRERSHGVAYTEWRFSLPREMTRREQMDGARDVLQSAFGTTHPYCWAFHDPLAADGQRQPHVHVLWSARTLDGIDRPEDQFFRRANRTAPALGGAQKDPEMNHMGAVKAARVHYTDVVNLHLERGGYEVRLHPDSLSDREMDREPEPKLLPSDSNAYKHGRVTEQMQKVLDHRAARAQCAEQEQANARIYWAFRSLVLGLEPGMTHAQQLTQIRAAREHAMTQQPERPHPSLHALQAEVQRLEQSVTGLERYGAQVRTFLRREERMEHLREARDWRDEAAAERCLAEGKHHGLAPDAYAERVATQIEDWLHAQEHEQRGGRLHIRLQQQDKDRDRGMSW